MFEATLSDARLWKNLLTAIATLVEEADFDTDQDAIKLRAMDPSHVAMVDFVWQKIAFEKYTCPQPTQIKINITNMLKTLKRIAPDEVLELHYDENDKKLRITLKGKMTRTFTIPTLSPSGEELPVPRITFDSTIKIVTPDFKDIIEDIQAVSDRITLETTQEKLTATATTETNSATIELEKGSKSMVSLDVKTPSSAIFSLGYLIDIMKTCASISETVTIEFSSNKPLKLSFEIPNGNLAYYLAPRVEPQE